MSLDIQPKNNQKDKDFQLKTVLLLYGFVLLLLESSIFNLLRHVIPKLFKFTRGFIFYKENGAGSSINGQEGSNTFKKYLFTEKKFVINCKCRSKNVVQLNRSILKSYVKYLGPLRDQKSKTFIIYL